MSIRASRGGNRPAATVDLQLGWVMRQGGIECHQRHTDIVRCFVIEVAGRETRFVVRTAVSASILADR